MDLEDLASLLNAANRLPRTSRSESIFSLGARSYFETPTSDLLAFFIDPMAQHGLRDLIASSLFAAAGLPLAEMPIELQQPPEREVVTSHGNKLDLVLRGSKWTVAIENKVYAAINNPLDDYVKHIRKQQRLPYCLPHHFLLLSAYPAGPSTPSPWVAVSYGDLVASVERELSGRFLEVDNPRWLLLLREFLLLLRFLSQGGSMDAAHREFIESNYAGVRLLSNMRHEYHRWVLSEGVRKIAALGCWGTDPPVVANQDWGDYGQALRFYPKHSQRFGDSNATLVIKTDGSFVPHAYLGGQAATDVRAAEQVMESIITPSGPPGSESRGRTLVYTFESTRSVESTLGALCKIAEAISRIFDRLQ